MYSCEYRMRKNKIMAKTFSKWNVVSMIKYHKPKAPWYLFAKILFEFFG